jgi:type IV secretion system protein VirB11
MTAPASYAESNLRPLAELLTADDVTEVAINPDGRVWVERSADAFMRAHDVALSPAAIRNLGSTLAGETGNALGERNPIVSGRVMVFGRSVRVQIVIPPAIEAGVSLSIRTYVARTIDVDELGVLGGASRDVEAERRERIAGVAALAEKGDAPGVLRRAVADRLNVLISGGTSSGKTTVARAMLALVPPEERIVTIEDAPELHPPHPNQVALVADRRPGSERSPAALLVSALRMRPDRLILGEMRGEEALGFLEAINTGHPGSISTIHADSPALALERLALMVMRTGLRLTREDVLAYARRTVDMVVQVARLGGRRSVTQVAVSP